MKTKITNALLQADSVDYWNQLLIALKYTNSLMQLLNIIRYLRSFKFFRILLRSERLATDELSVIMFERCGKPKTDQVKHNLDTVIYRTSDTIESYIYMYMS